MVLEFALCIYNSDGLAYIELLPYIATFIQLFSKRESNYFKAILYHYANMKYLIRVNHPTLPVITNYFAAFNEEKGEKSIHDAFRYIHNSDYSYENLDSHYRMLPSWGKNDYPKCSPRKSSWCSKKVLRKVP